MASWTNIPNANLAAGAPIRSVDTLALRDNSAYNKQNVELELLNTQIFTSSGTWTKPTGSEYNATDTVVAMYFGAGGSGGSCLYDDASGFGTGGDGGPIGILQFNYGTIASSLSVTIGAGGAAATPPLSGNYARRGNKGGTTSFNGFSIHGGSGGYAQGQYGGEYPINSERGKGFTTTALSGSGNGGQPVLFEGGLGRESDQSTTGIYPAPHSGAGGGGGAAFRSGSINNTNNQAGGISIFGLAGAGGAGGLNANGTAGSAPSGGGGGAVGQSTTRASGAGGRGEMRIYVVRGKVPLNSFIGAL